MGLQDQAIPAPLQRYMAKRLGATVIEIEASHVSFISQPRAVLRVIEAAAAATKE